MRTTLVLLAALAGIGFSSLGLASQIVWKWVDENGVTHYADRPVPGATRMEINAGVSSGSESSSSGSSSSPAPAQPASTGPVYVDFEIRRPGDEETIANTGGQLTVDLRIEPVLRPGHSLSLYMDGRLVDGYPTDAVTFDLKDVPRGTHTLRAIISDGGGKRIQETEQITIFVQQASAAQPPVGPALRPPPKPQPRPRGASNKLPSTQPTYAALHATRTAPIDPVTNRPVVTKPATPKPTTPGPKPGK